MPTFKPELTIAVQVSDWLAARDWYRDVLGLEETFVVEEGGWAEFAGPLGVVIGLSALHGQAHPGVGGTTITFGVSDIEAARAELEDNRVQFTGPTTELPGMVKLATFKDPDGNEMMLAENLMQP
ncbi:MAG: VOC family protein [Dehalococcoidia bacterium]|nr:VOC family protein [Dehalococcoidia bacterium]